MVKHISRFRVLCIGGSSVTFTPGLQAHWPDELSALLSAQAAGSPAGRREVRPQMVMEFSTKGGRTLHELLRDVTLLNTIETGNWDAVVLEVGTTDGLKSGTPKRLYADALHQLLQRLCMNGIPVVLCTPPRVVAQEQAHKGWGRRVRRWIDYAPTLMQQAVDDVLRGGNEAALVAWHDMSEAMYAPDGVHPNAAGAAWMAGRVRDGLVAIVERQGRRSILP